MESANVRDPAPDPRRRKRRCSSSKLSVLPVRRSPDDGEDRTDQYVLALFRLRRGLEPFARPETARPAPDAIVVNAMHHSADASTPVLAEHFASLHVLARRLPVGDNEDDVRRCIAALIAADRSSQWHAATIVMRGLVRLQHERQHGLRRAYRHRALAVEQLLASLCETVVPLLQPLGLSRSDAA